MKKKMVWLLVFAMLLGLVTTACSSPNEEPQTDSKQPAGETDPQAPADDFSIGVSFYTLQEERYQREAEVMETWLKENYPNASYVFQGADSDANKQYSQCETMITQGVDVLILNCQDVEIGANIVNMAHNAGVITCGYDYELMNCEVDVFVTMSLVRAGELMAEWTMNHLDFDSGETYRIYLMEGDSTSRNAMHCNNGKMNILQPYIDEGKIEIVGEQWCANWSSASGLANMENALTALDNDVDAVICSNDGIATGVCQALEAQGLAGDVIVTGQDGELAACQRIVAGVQSMTVYKPGLTMAEAAIATAVDFYLGKDIAYDDHMDNGLIEVPTVIPPIYAVDAENMDDTIIADGWQSSEEVYKGAR